MVLLAFSILEWQRTCFLAKGVLCEEQGGPYGKFKTDSSPLRQWVQPDWLYPHLSPFLSVWYQWRRSVYSELFWENEVGIQSTGWQIENGIQNSGPWLVSSHPSVYCDHLCSLTRRTQAIGWDESTGAAVFTKRRIGSQVPRQRSLFPLKRA